MLPNAAASTFGGVHNNGQKAKASVVPVTAVTLSRLGWYHQIQLYLADNNLPPHTQTHNFFVRNFFLF